MQKFLLLPLFVLTLFGILFLLKNSFRKESRGNQTEASVPSELDRKAFFEHIKTVNGQWIDNAPTPTFDNETVAALPSKPQEDTTNAVLGSHTGSDGSEKWIQVDISDQKLYAWEGNRKAYEFPISSGRPGYDTVKGEFKVWRKVRSQTFRGGSRQRGDYYYLPNVPYSLFFHEGYAIHGAYWHNDFGIKRRSSGCVNLSIPNAEKIYNWAGPAIPSRVTALNSTDENPGVRVVVHD